MELIEVLREAVVVCENESSYDEAEAVAKAIDQLRWRNVKDELPSDHEIVRCANEISECYGWVIHEQHAGVIWVLDDGHDYTPTHWQPLSPLPPGEEQ